MYQEACATASRQSTREGERRQIPSVGPDIALSSWQHIRCWNILVRQLRGEQIYRYDTCPYEGGSP